MDKTSITRVPPSLQYVITGTGHCGTTWATAVAASVGYRSCHEQVFRRDEIKEVPDQDGVPIPWEVESSAYAAPRLSELVTHMPAIKVIHLVRHPLDTIRSLACSLNGGWANRGARDYVQGVVPAQLPNDSVVNFNLHFWVRWTDAIDDFAKRYPASHALVQLEDGTDALTAALGRITNKEVLPVGERKAKDAPILRWEDLPNSYIRERAFRKSLDYGYIPGVTTHWGAL